MVQTSDTGSGWLLAERYRVLDRIGAGGMADVFRAHDELLDRDVAVKVFRTLAVAADATGVERQQLELHALARLNHPNLITLYDGSIAAGDGPAHLVMELVTGPSLSARIAESALPEAQARELGIQIAEALAYVHAEGMVHRDVKPANILLGTDFTLEHGTMRARLSDFGIVRLLDSEGLTGVHSTLGTASYLAPEQARGSDVGPPADIYSLGLVLIEAVTAVRCFAGAPLEAMAARLTRGPQIPEQLPSPWPELLAWMTAADPTARPTAAQVAQTLRDGSPRPAPVPAGLGMAGAPADAATVALAAAVRPLPVAVAEPLASERAGGHLLGWLLAAAAAVVALGIAGVLLFKPSSGANEPAGGGVAPPASAGSDSHAARTHPAVAGNRSRARSGSIGPAQPSQPVRSTGSSTAASTSASTSSSAPASTSGSTSAAPSTSATSTSAAPSTSATSTGATSTSATSTSAAPTTSPPPTSPSATNSTGNVAGGGSSTTAAQTKPAPPANPAG